MNTGRAKPNHLVWLMLVLVYVSWGSVYLGNKLSLEIAGPFLVCGVRNTLAGLLMLAFAICLKDKWKRPSAKDVALHAAMAVLLVLASGGFLVLGQTRVSSMVTAVVMSSTPIFMLLGAWLFAGEERPNLPQCVGMITGACGVVFLSLREQSEAAGSLLGIVILLGAVCGWVAGSLVMKKIPVGRNYSMLESTGLILFLGGVESVVASLLLGEAATFRPENMGPANLAAFAWMVVGGSFIAYWSYLWLLANVSVSLAVSYEYVVPVIGIFLGWWIGGEEVRPSTILACLVTVSSVFLVVRHRHGIKVYVRHYFIHRVQMRKERALREKSH